MNSVCSLRLLTLYNYNSGWYTIVSRLIHKEADVIIILRTDWLIIHCFTSHARVFFTYMERSALPVKVCKIWVYAWRSGPLSREGTLSCHTCCDTGPRFSILIQRTGPFSRLLRHTRGCWGLIITRILTGLIQQMVKAVRNGVKGISVVCEDTVV